jgi:hypothetical protein
VVENYQASISSAWNQSSILNVTKLHVGPATGLLTVLSYVFSSHTSKDLLRKSILSWQDHGQINVPLKARFSLRASLSLHASYLHSLSGTLNNIASYPMDFLDAGNQLVNGRIYVDTHVRRC